MGDSQPLHEIVESLVHEQGLANQIKGQVDRFSRLLDAEARGVLSVWFSRGHVTRVRVEVLPAGASGRGQLRGEKP